MQGLQQYNFFPTDFFYPRPQPSATTLEISSGKPKVVLLQTPKGEKQSQGQQARRMIIVPSPRHVLVCTPKNQSLIDKKLSKLSAKPLSWAILLAEEEEDEAF